MVVMTQAALDEFALANGFGKTTKAMTEQEKVALRYQFVMKNLSTASGDFQRTSNGWANQTKILSEQFNALKASIGQGLINALLPVVKVLNTLMEKLVVVSNLFSNWTAKLFGKAEVTTTKVASSMEDGLSGIVDSAESASDAIGGVANAAKKAAKQSLGFDELNVLSKPEEDSSGGGGVGDVGSVGGGGLTEITEQTEDLTNKETILDKVLNKLKNIDFTNLKNSFENLKKSIAPIIDLIGKGLKWAFDNILVPFGKWTIEKALPSTMNLLAGAFELIGAVAANIGPKLAYIWDNFLSPIMGFVGDAIISALDGIAGGLSSIADNETAVDILGNLVIAFGGIMVSSKVIGIITGIANALTILGGSLKALAGGELLKATSIFGKLANVFSLVAGGAGTLHEAMVLVFGKIGTVLGGVGALISGAVIAVKNFFDMWKKGWNVLDAILTAIGVAIAAVGAVILGVPGTVAAVVAGIVILVSNLVIVIKDNWESIKAVTISVFTSIGNFFVNCWNWIVEFGKAVVTAYISTVKRNWEVLKEATIFVFNFIKNFFVECWTNIKNFFVVTIPAIVNFVILKWTEFKEKISTVISIIKDFLIDSWSNIKERVFSFISNLVDSGKQKFENFKNGIVSVFSTVKDTILNVFSIVGTFVGDKIDFLKEKAISGFSMIKDGASSIFSGMKDAISSIFSSLVNIIKMPINGIISIVNQAIDAINGLNIEIPDFVPGIGGNSYGFNLEKIPMLAQGAYITGPQLAMVGEAGPEIVAPESKMRQIEKEGNIETNAYLQQIIRQNQELINIMNLLLNKNQDVYLDRDRVGTLLTNYQNSESRRRG